MIVIYLLGVVLAVILLLLINKWYCESKISDLNGTVVAGIIFISIFSWLSVIAIIMVMLLLLILNK